MSSPKILCYLLYATTICAVIADPICRPSPHDPRTVGCLPGDNDSVLKRWLVSDNKLTTKITMRGCRIVEVEKEAFIGIPSLTDIDLSSNRISSLDPSLFEGAPQLFRINLSNNTVTDLPVGLLAQNHNLNTLDLKGNRLQELKVGIFDSLSVLRYLDFSGNSLVGRNLSPYLFERSRLIRFMDFSINDMSEVDEELLRAFQDIEFLNLHGCSLSEVPAFATKPNLAPMKRLFLSANQISQINNPTTFVHLGSLVELNLADNVLTNVEENVFKPMRELKIITLRNNRLKYLPETLFQNMPSISNIDLANNFLTYVPVNAFRGTPLRNLNIANNRFTYLTDNFCLELRNSGANLQKFYFNQNPWQCKCLLDVLQEVQRMNINYNRVKYDGAHPVCVSEDFVCQRQDSVNDMYVDLYNELVINS